MNLLALFFFLLILCTSNALQLRVQAIDLEEDARLSKEAGLSAAQIAERREKLLLKQKLQEKIKQTQLETNTYYLDNLKLSNALTMSRNIRQGDNGTPTNSDAMFAEAQKQRLEFLARNQRSLREYIYSSKDLLALNNKLINGNDLVPSKIKDKFKEDLAELAKTPIIIFASDQEEK